jgi:NADPH2:quinone reductase
MLHRSVRVPAGQPVLVHGAAGGVGTALVQLARLAGLEVYGTCSARGETTVSALGAIPIDYRQQDFVEEMRRRADGGAAAVFDGIGGTHMWRSRKALRAGGTVVVYGLTSSLSGGRLADAAPGRRRRFHGLPIFGLYILGGLVLPGRRRVVPYSIQWLMRRRPAYFRADLAALLELLRERKIRPLVAQRFPLAEARRAHELLGAGGVTGKFVLVLDEPAPS